MRFAAFTLAALLSACATCRREPVACAVDAAVVVAAAVYADQSSNTQIHHHSNIQPFECGAICD